MAVCVKAGTSSTRVAVTENQGKNRGNVIRFYFDSEPFLKHTREMVIILYCYKAIRQKRWYSVRFNVIHLKRFTDSSFSA